MDSEKKGIDKVEEGACSSSGEKPEDKKPKDSQEKPIDKRMVNLLERVDELCWRLELMTRERLTSFPYEIPDNLKHLQRKKKNE
ncbi:hypothetical protein TNIN_393031 [Trichonephila inaurata madagascariensis]|uniref:Uncharacterized protein n=1 Tax=Trichonephila inaurata madagascariensis TaxID=2747483 RepID=A0A8X6XTA0_9ARAC|nr:hypothetical protein TNIN_393031 [Trichonephila inaurata madagascariensis]